MRPLIRSLVAVMCILVTVGVFVPTANEGKVKQMHISSIAQGVLMLVPLGL